MTTVKVDLFREHRDEYAMPRAPNLPRETCFIRQPRRNRGAPRPVTLASALTVDQPPCPKLDVVAAEGLARSVARTRPRSSRRARSERLVDLGRHAR